MMWHYYDESKGDHCPEPLKIHLVVRTFNVLKFEKKKSKKPNKTKHCCSQNRSGIDYLVSVEHEGLVICSQFHVRPAGWSGPADPHVPPAERLELEIPFPRLHGVRLLHAELADGFDGLVHHHVGAWKGGGGGGRETKTVVKSEKEEEDEEEEEVFLLLEGIEYEWQQLSCVSLSLQLNKLNYTLHSEALGVRPHPHVVGQPFVRQHNQTKV